MNINICRVLHFYDSLYDNLRFYVFQLSQKNENNYNDHDIFKNNSSIIRSFRYMIYFSRNLTKFLFFSRFTYVTSTYDAFFDFVNVDL
jgi:hypothetical protein